MDTYSITRQFADSWMLLAMFVFFLGIVVWVMRPGSSKEYKDVANIPFRHENKPAEDIAADAQRKEARP
ncbi:Cbb3-type cytochrome oxidase component FixQ [Pseudoruegeria aquimaris]|uniref:Cbb3-type cytochrome oxidase component FixQ n=1 Tax=Pseudoruegeria aquimaris TaxID=393663 RepID=A0A1Y5SZD3_9RHOB|nr:cbb3-type cytochrome c oxidase subunit 3 [Pseudoruegeria aquimaris]SLN50103.1 Cbb3-type cytochrome oxidase component FixQ [Pseudoruegeria aquimaris]